MVVGVGVREVVFKRVLKGGNRKKRSCCLRERWGSTGMLERCGGGRDHADEEKCQTVLDQAGQRHFGTRDHQNFQPEVDTLKWSECQDASGAPALLFYWIWVFLVYFGHVNSYSVSIIEVSLLPTTLHQYWKKKNPLQKESMQTATRGTSTMAPPACKWLPL